MGLEYTPPPFPILYQSNAMNLHQTHKGILFALAAYFIWGIAPIYFRLLDAVSTGEILAHRIIWSFFFMLILLTLSRGWGQVRQACKNGRRILLLGVSAVMVGVNWMIFIWAINHHLLLEASLGYFINPLVNVLLGILFLHERFRRLQWLAMALALTGVLVQLWQFGTIPMVALGLAFSFAFYALLRKKIGIEAQTGMLFETLWLLPVALVYLLFVVDTNTSHFSQNPWSLNLTLMAAGVITTVPLLFFTASTKYLRLSTLGFFQYIGPSLMFLLAVCFYGEQVGSDKLVAFSFIWVALLVFIFDAIYHQRRSSR